MASRRSPELFEVVLRSDSPLQVVELWGELDVEALLPGSLDAALHGEPVARGVGQIEVSPVGVVVERRASVVAEQTRERVDCGPDVTALGERVGELKQAPVLQNARRVGAPPQGSNGGFGIPCGMGPETQ